MHNNVADQNGETVQLVRFGPSTSRPQSPPQSLWRGSLPQGVKKIMTRTALAQHHRVSYAKWASNFVLLTNEFITQVMKGAAKTADQSSPRKWTGYKFVDWYFCDVGDDYLWVQKQDGGWTVELCYPDADPDARILTIENMPVLCPDAPSAAALAEGGAISSRPQIWSGILISNYGLVKMGTPDQSGADRGNRYVVAR